MESIEELKRAVVTFGKTISDELTEIADNLAASDAANDDEIEAAMNQVNSLKTKVEQEIKTLVPGA